MFNQLHVPKLNVKNGKGKVSPHEVPWAKKKTNFYSFNEQMTWGQESERITFYKRVKKRPRRPVFQLWSKEREVLDVIQVLEPCKWFKMNVNHAQDKVGSS